MENCYECFNSTLCYKCFFISWCVNSSNLIFCNECINSRDCIMCYGLVNKQYCILNKQYSPQEYEEQISKIIKYLQSIWEWWKFLPTQISPFWYNESLAMDYRPIDMQTALDKWFRWQVQYYPIGIPQWIETISALNLPDRIMDVDDSILKKAILCARSEKPFKLMAWELDFYKKNWIALPRFHPEERHADRMKLRNSWILNEDKCDKCGKVVKTTYPSWRNVKIFCNECYKQEIY